MWPELRTQEGGKESTVETLPRDTFPSSQGLSACCGETMFIHSLVMHRKGGKRPALVLLDTWGLGILQVSEGQLDGSLTPEVSGHISPRVTSWESLSGI